MGASTNPGSGVVILTDCTLTANAAVGGNGGSAGNGGSGLGGALFNLDGFVTLNDDTLAANTVVAGAGGGRQGGAVYNLADGNNINTGGSTSALLVLNNSILSNSSGGGSDLASVAFIGNSPDTASIAGSSSLVQSMALFNVSLDPGVITVTANPNLGPLASNGGPTQTMALTTSSPAFGAGNPGVSGLPAGDQRGLPRLNNGRLDLGAYEDQLPVLSSLSLNTALEGSAAFTLTLTGNFFDRTATVLWGSTPLTTVFQGATQLQARVPAGLLAEQGSATVSVTEDTGPSGGLHFSITDAPLGSLSIHNPRAVAGVSTGTFTVAVFRDGNTAAPTTDFTATVGWGNGSTSTITGSGIVAAGGGTFDVLASHTWAAAGTFTLSVHVGDVGGSSASGSITISVASAAIAIGLPDPPAAPAPTLTAAAPSPSGGGSSPSSPTQSSPQPLMDFLIELYFLEVFFRLS
jgi:hypothetical protein